MNRSKLQKGSALSIMLILAMGVGSVVTSFLGRTLVEQSRVSQRAASMRAYRQAVGQMELAKSIVNASAYAGGQNVAVTTALAANPPVIAGTGVMVEATGAARWYRLVSCADFADQTAAVSAFMRDGTPYVSYNYYVEEHPLGISGRPRGKLHTNQELEFYFPNGLYDGFVSAVDGFTYKSGAAANNTLIMGGSDPAAGVKDLLDLIDFNALKAQATVVTPANLDARITLANKNVNIELWSKPTTALVPVTKIKKVQTGSVWSPTTQPVYTKQWQWVSVQQSKKVWVVVAPVNNGGTDLGGGGSAGGYWKTVYFNVMQFKQVNVQTGTTTVWKWLPVYTDVPYTAWISQVVPGSLQDATAYNVYDTDSKIFYISGDVQTLSGNINGRATIVADHDVMINGSIRYVDDNNQFACLNGLTPAQPYDVNPTFVRNHALGLIAKNDIRFARTAPATMEVNASLISTNGMIGMEGIVLDAAANPSLSGAAAIKTSLRRYGTVMSAKRPVSTLLDVANQVIHGFQQGSSQYDSGLVMIVPPGYPSEEVSLWEPVVKADGGNFTDAGDGTYDANLVTPVAGNLMPIRDVRSLVQGMKFDWGACQ